MMDGLGDGRDQWLAKRPIEAQPIEMKPQELWNSFDATERPGFAWADDSATSRFARLVLVLLTSAATLAFGAWLYKALALHNGGTPLHYLFLVLSTISFAWVAFGAANAAIGACSLLFGSGGDSITPAPAGTPMDARTALLFPIYHEDPEAIAGNIRDLVRDIHARGATAQFAFFVLSDSQTEDDRVREREIFSRLASDIGDQVTLVYRNRSRNIGKKAENIADWVRTHGGGYDFFIVFDADSVISVETLMRLVATIEAHPDTALVQTVPRLFKGETVFSHLQQFANNVFGPLGAAGLAAWQGASGNYWGHNAIIRTRAFADSAGLPTLAGDAPWGGHVQSHDFIEAALLRRAGWRIALVTSLEGTLEQSPPTLVEHVVRDRRWMQGNLQHAKILGASGLTPVSRLHLMMGIVTYVSSTIWLLVILVGLCLMWLEQQRVVSYFDRTKSLFPNWPTYDPAAALQLLGATMLIVLIPKFLGLALAIGRLVRDRLFLRRGTDLLTHWILEVLHSVLIAPVSMLNQVKAFVELLLWQDSGWKPQTRAGMIIPLGQAVRFHRFHVIVGVLLGVAAASLSWYALAWLTPVVLGLVLSPLVTWVTSRPKPPTDLPATRAHPQRS